MRRGGRFGKDWLRGDKVAQGVAMEGQGTGPVCRRTLPPEQVDSGPDHEGALLGDSREAVFAVERGDRETVI
jgi:hypothetical protein